MRLSIITLYLFCYTQVMPLVSFQKVDPMIELTYFHSKLVGRYAIPLNEDAYSLMILVVILTFHDIPLSFNDLSIFHVGVTIMALTALESNPSLPLKIIPCGLNYFHGHRFRSSAYLDIGE